MDQPVAESGGAARGSLPGGGKAVGVSSAGEERLCAKSACTFLVQEKRGLRFFQVLTAPSPDSKKGKKKLVELFHRTGMQQATWSPCGRRLAIVSQEQGLLVFQHPTWAVEDVAALWNRPAAPSSYCSERGAAAKAAKGGAGGVGSGVEAEEDEEAKREEISQALISEIEQLALRLPEGSLAASSQSPPKYLQWSPLGTYLVAFYNVENQRKAMGDDEVGSQDHNVFVWNVGTKAIVASFYVRRLVGSQWPLLKWRDDELFCCIASRNCIQVFAGHDLKKMLLRFAVPRVFNIELAPCFSPELEQELMIGAFCPAASPPGPTLSSVASQGLSTPNPQTAQFYVFQIPSVAAAAAEAAASRSCDVDWTLNPQTALQDLLQAQRPNFEKTESALKSAAALVSDPNAGLVGGGKAEKKKAAQSDSETEADAKRDVAGKQLVFHTVDEEEVKGALAAASTDVEAFERALVRCVVRQVVAVADSAELAWSPSGTGLIVMANTTVDAAGENYGGVGDCWYFCREPPLDEVARLQQMRAEMESLLSSCGSSSPHFRAIQAAAASVHRFADAIQNLTSFVKKLSKKVAQDAKWSPTRDEFVLIEGKSPSDIYLLDKHCHIRFSFPPKYRNTINWGPFGQMVAIGGFGNLAGELSFWYRDSNVRGMSLITEWRAACTVQSLWAPSGDLFLTASTYPRMKVDNVFRVFDYEGEEIASVKFEELYKVAWKPESDLAPPPAPQRNELALEQTSKGFYRPKNAQGILARVMRGELDESALPEELRRKPEDAKKKRGAAGTPGTAGASGAAPIAADGSTAPAGTSKKAERDWGGLLDWRLHAKEESRAAAAAAAAGSGPEASSEEGTTASSKGTAADAVAGAGRARGRTKSGAGAQSPAPAEAAARGVSGGAAATRGGAGASQGGKGTSLSSASSTFSTEQSRRSSRSPVPSEGAKAPGDREEDKEKPASVSSLSSPRGESAGAQASLSRSRGAADGDNHSQERKRDGKGKGGKSANSERLDAGGTEGGKQEIQQGIACHEEEAETSSSVAGTLPEEAGARAARAQEALSTAQQRVLHGHGSVSFLQALTSSNSSSLFRPSPPSSLSSGAAGPSPLSSSYPGVIGPSSASSRSSSSDPAPPSAASSGAFPSTASPPGAAAPGRSGTVPVGGGAGPSGFNKAPGPSASHTNAPPHYEELLRAFRNIVPPGALHVLQHQEGRGQQLSSLGGVSADGRGGPGAQGSGPGGAAGGFGQAHGADSNAAAVANAQAALGAVLARLQQQSKAGSGGAGDGRAGSASVPGHFRAAPGGAGQGGSSASNAAAFCAELASRVQQQRGMAGGAGASSVASSQLLKQQLLQQFARQQGQLSGEGLAAFMARSGSLGEGGGLAGAASEGRGPSGPGAGSAASSITHAQEVMQLLEHLRRGNTAEAVQFAQGSRAVWALLQAAAQKQKLPMQTQAHPKDMQQHFQGQGLNLGARKGGNVNSPRSVETAAMGMRGSGSGAAGSGLGSFSNSSYQGGLPPPFLSSSFSGESLLSGGEGRVGCGASSALHPQSDAGFLADFMTLQLRRKAAEAAGAQQASVGDTRQGAFSASFPGMASTPGASTASSGVSQPRGAPQETRSPSSLAAVTAAAVEALTQQYPQLTKEQAVLLLQKLRLSNSGLASSQNSAHYSSGDHHLSGSSSSSSGGGPTGMVSAAPSQGSIVAEGLGLAPGGGAFGSGSFSSFASARSAASEGGRGGAGRQQLMGASGSFEGMGEERSKAAGAFRTAASAAQRESELLGNSRNSAVSKGAASAGFGPAALSAGGEAVLRGWSAGGGANGALPGSLSSAAAAGAGGFSGEGPGFSSGPAPQYLQDPSRMPLGGGDRARDAFGGGDERRDAFGAGAFPQEGRGYFLPRGGAQAQTSSGEREGRGACPEGDTGSGQPWGPAGASGAAAAQGPGAGAASAGGERGGKRPDAMKDKCWQYVDPKGNIQGPFHREEMAMWNAMGYFDPALPVRCCGADRFIPLNKLYPPPQQPFSTTPKPQPMHI
ncbi:GYF domain-containing protein [Besnoitia besnoiti]|uniref:Eukaryotic translation initiation factor 2A n=1 Tax=Besnoitia besnoiti TaxID=94643 RepID=A0A2A9MDY7_BESBE|nr:GYF domain-containing protein [Besnoitia besnoiti]PFH34481.1 GYF domain-containing protein [Besnoitia besnoiti]